MTFNQWVKSMFVTPSEADVLRTQLADAKVRRAEQSALREYHSAMEKMLQARVARLERELKEKGYADK